MLRTRLVACALVVAALSVGCARQETEEDTVATADSTGFRRDSAATERRFRRINDEIDSLSARVVSADRRVRVTLVQQIERLRNERDSTARRLDDLRAGGRDAWERAKVGTDSLLGGLERAIGNARQSIRGSRDTIPR